MTQDARKDIDPDDPKGLIREAYRIEGISASDCRTIFLDWALSHRESGDQAAAIARLHARKAAEAPDHPMTAVLSEARLSSPTPSRRGGWRGRRSQG
ncbi:hypothetical protein [Poseidonocella sedimentorum]|uniref:Uncharacterized protein n=1 Tax=Poseidonocella sedimentorum TaxID=871652 RepID=A0A1I6DET7_9RHOB|nr:hypothetical protein [Poseidonocella sedimentorum]SFR03969.1 hypothetical protein SAMN04515673_10394 [Poseidonocella sedimentorum]